MRRRSTLQITLVLVGTIALAGCKEQGQRHVYQGKEDCLKDWGGDPKSCEEVARTDPAYKNLSSQHSGHRSGGSHRSYFYGPWYRSGTVFTGGQGNHALRTMSVSRGGFGSSSGFHGSGGS